MLRRKKSLHVLSNNTGEVTLLREIMYGILSIAVLFVLYAIFANYGSFLFGGGSSQQAEDSFHSLAFTLQHLTKQEDPYAVISEYPYTLGSQRNTLVGFDAGGIETTTTGIDCLTARRKPASCGSKACICLFDASFNPAPGQDLNDHLKGLVDCKRIEGVATSARWRRVPQHVKIKHVKIMEDCLAEKPDFDP